MSNATKKRAKENHDILKKPLSTNISEIIIKLPANAPPTNFQDITKIYT